MWLIVIPLDVPTLTTSRLPKRSWHSEVALCRNLILDVPTFTTSRLPRDPSSQRWNYVGRNGRWILPEIPDFHVAFRHLLHAVNNLRHGTDGFTSSPKEGVLRIFSSWKIRRLRPGLNPRTWVPKASTLPLDHRSRLSSSHFLQKISREIENFFTCHKQETQRLTKRFFYTLYQRLSHNVCFCTLYVLLLLRTYCSNCKYASG